MFALRKRNRKRGLGKIVVSDKKLKEIEEKESILGQNKEFRLKEALKKKKQQQQCFLLTESFKIKS